MTRQRFLQSRRRTRNPHLARCSVANFEPPIGRSGFLQSCRAGSTRRFSTARKPRWPSRNHCGGSEFPAGRDDEVSEKSCARLCSTTIFPPSRNEIGPTAACVENRLCQQSGGSRRISREHSGVPHLLRRRRLSPPPQDRRVAKTCGFTVRILGFAELAGRRERQPQRFRRKLPLISQKSALGRAHSPRLGRVAGFRAGPRPLCRRALCVPAGTPAK